MTWHNSLLELTKLTVCIAIKEPILLQNSNLGTQNKNIKKRQSVGTQIYLCLLAVSSMPHFLRAWPHIFTFLGKDSFNCLIAYLEMCLLFRDVVLFEVTTSLAFVKKTEQHFVFQHFLQHKGGLYQFLNLGVSKCIARPQKGNK